MALQQETFQPLDALTAELLQGDRALQLPDGAAQVFGLFLDYPSGRLSFRTFATDRERRIFITLLESQPVVLRPVTYTR